MRGKDLRVAADSSASCSEGAPDTPKWHVVGDTGYSHPVTSLVNCQSRRATRCGISISRNSANQRLISVNLGEIFHNSI